MNYFSPGVINGPLYKTGSTFMGRGDGFKDWLVNASTAGQGRKERIPGAGHSLMKALNYDIGGSTADRFISDLLSTDQCEDPQIFSIDHPDGVANNTIGGGAGGGGGGGGRVGIPTASGGTYYLLVHYFCTASGCTYVESWVIHVPARR